jgi:hypothetical protein
MSTDIWSNIPEPTSGNRKLTEGETVEGTLDKIAMIPNPFDPAEGDVLGLTIGDVVFDPLGFGPDDGDITSDTSRSYLRLIFAVLGAVIFGWMVTIAGLVVGPLARRERWAWNTTVVATAMWFLLDTGASLLLGFVGHALFNVGFGIALAVPLIAIQRDYADKGVQLVGINPNDDENYPDDSFDKMVARAAEKGFNFPYLRDESQEVARAYDAACTPDIFVFDRDRKLVYNGRIDDNWQQPENVTRKDLRAVLDATLEGKAFDFEPVPSMGCSIKWK